MSVPPFTVASGFLDNNQASMYFVKKHIDKLKEDKEELLNGEGSDTVANISDLKTKLTNLGILDNNGDVQTDIAVVVKLSGNEVDDAEDLKDNSADPQIHLKVGGNDKGVINFDIKSAETVLQNTISEETTMLTSLKQAKSAVKATFGTVNSADTNGFIEKIVNDFTAVANNVQTALNNMESSIVEYNDKLNDSSSGFKALLQSMGYSTPSSDSFDDVKGAVKSAIQTIINDVTNQSIKIGDAIQNIKNIILGDGTHTGYVEVFKSYKKVTAAREQALSIKTAIENYKDYLSNQISTVKDSFSQIDKHFEFESNGNFKLDTLEKVQKIGENIVKVIQQGTKYYKAEVAYAVADVVDQLSKKLGEAIENITEGASVTTNANGDKVVQDVQNVKNDLSAISNNLSSLSTNNNLSLGDFKDLVTSKISSSNVSNYIGDLVSAITNSVNNINTSSVTTSIDASNDDFAKAFSAVKSYTSVADQAGDYFQSTINTVKDNLSKHKDWQSLAVQKIDNDLSETIHDLENDASTIINYVENGQLEKLQNDVYSSVKSELQDIVDTFNDKKSQYDQLGQQITQLSTQIADADDPTQYQDDLLNLLNQQDQIINDIATNWWNSINTAYSNASSKYNTYNTQYTNLANKSDLTGQEYASLAKYEIQTAAEWFEQQILDKIKSAINGKTHTYGSNTVTVDTSDGLSHDEAEVLLDVITSIAMNLPATLDDAAALGAPDIELDATDINSINVTA